MQKHLIDYGKLADKLSKRAYKLSDVKDRLEVVGFDIVRFKDGDEASRLWQIQNADDGDYIVSLYEDNKDNLTAAWNVVLSKTAKSIYVYYKGEPIVKVATNKLGIPETELASVERYLPKKLAENKRLVAALLNELDGSAKKLVLDKYPELA